MFFQIAQHRKLLMQTPYRFWIGQRIAAPQPAAFDRGLKRREKNNIMKRLLQPLEWMEEPGTYDSIHNDEIIALRVSFRCLSKDRHNHRVLPTRFGQVGRNCSLFNEMPEIIRMQMHGRPVMRRNKALGCRALSSTGWTGQYEDVP